jgi:hypothetical protein
MLAMPDLRMGVDVPPDGNQSLTENGGLPRDLSATLEVGVGTDIALSLARWARRVGNIPSRNKTVEFDENLLVVRASDTRC